MLLMYEVDLQIALVRRFVYVLSAPINCFRDGGEGGQSPGELIFSEKSCQIPVPWANIACQIPHPRD